MRCEAYIEINHEPCRDPMLAELVLAALHREERSSGPSTPCESTDVVSGLWIIELPPRLAHPARRDRQMAARIEIDRQVAFVVVELP
jgi:hypothetical protein